MHAFLVAPQHRFRTRKQALITLPIVLRQAVARHCVMWCRPREFVKYLLHQCYHSRMDQRMPFRKSNERLNRYRYEIAAAVLLTIASVALLAATAFSSEDGSKSASNFKFHSTQDSN